MASETGRKVSAVGASLRTAGVALLSLVSLACCLGTGSRVLADAGPTPVDARERLPVDGASLSLVTRGVDRSAPILLWLHGGPGGAESPLFRLFDGALEDHFVVAYWDQRGAGRSFDPDADPALLTIDRHLADLDAVVDRLTATFGRARVILVGHSWGSALGLLYAQQHPEKVAAFVGVGQVVSVRAQRRAQYEFVRREAERLGDDSALETLREIGEPPWSAEQDLAVGRLVDRFGGLFHQRPSFFWTVLRGVGRGIVTPWEIPRFIRANEISLEAMNDELQELDLRRRVPRVEVPVFFFLGRWDRKTDPRLAAAYLEQLEAPEKECVWFENAAHNVPFEEPLRFQETLVRVLREAQIAR